MSGIRSDAWWRGRGGLRDGRGRIVPFQSSAPPEIPLGAYADWDALLMDFGAGASVSGVDDQSGNGRDLVQAGSAITATGADYYSEELGKNVALPQLALNEYLRFNLPSAVEVNSMTIVWMELMDGDSPPNGAQIGGPFDGAADLILPRRYLGGSSNVEIQAGGWLDVATDVSHAEVTRGSGYWRIFAARIETTDDTGGAGQVRVRMRHAQLTAAGVVYDGETTNTVDRYTDGGAAYWEGLDSWQWYGIQLFARAAVWQSSDLTEAALSDAAVKTAMVAVLASHSLDDAEALEALL